MENVGDVRSTMLRPEVPAGTLEVVATVVAMAAKAFVVRVAILMGQSLHQQSLFL